MISIWHEAQADDHRRGEEFGRRWRERVRTTLAEYDELFGVRGIALSTAREVSEISQALLARHAPSVLAEIEGLAAGAQIEPWQAMELSARTEILARTPAVAPGRSPAVEECSTAVYLPADGGAPRSMQTWDWYHHMAEDTVVRVFPRGDGTRIATYCEFGQVGKIGVNSRGLGVHLNILAHTSDGSRDGVPVHVLARMILDRASTVAEALAIVDSVPLGASTVLTVVTAHGGGEAACIELSPAGSAAIRATAGEPLLHTNHFLDPGLAAGSVVSDHSTSRPRLDFLRAHADAVALADPLARVQALAAGEPGSICVTPDPSRAAHDRPETKATLTLDVANRELGIAESHPAAFGAEDWQRVRL